MIGGLLPGRRAVAAQPATELRPYSSALSSHLVCAVTPQDGGAHVQNRIEQSYGLLTGTTKPSWVDGRLNFPGGAVGNAQVDWGINKSPQTRDLAMGAFSVVARLYYRGGLGGICERNDGNALNAGWEITLGTATSRFGIAFVRPTTNLTAYAAALPTNKWITVAMCYPGTLTASAIRFYVEGVAQTHVVDVDGSGALGTDFSHEFFLGRSTFSQASSGAATLDGLIEYVYVYRRFLRHEEVLALMADPYRIFRAPLPILLGEDAPLTMGWLPVVTQTPPHRRQAARESTGTSYLFDVPDLAPFTLGWMPQATPILPHHREAVHEPEARTQPFPIVVPDIGASLTFQPVLAPPSARPVRAPVRQEIVTPLDPPSVLAPSVWQPILAGPLPRPPRAREEAAVIDPTFGGGVTIAAQMGWAVPVSDPPRSPRSLRTSATAEVSPFIVPAFPVAVPCVDLQDGTLTISTLLAEALTAPDLFAELLTVPTLLGEDLC